MAFKCIYIPKLRISCEIDKFRKYISKICTYMISENFLTALCTPIMTNFTLIDGGFWSPLFNKQTNNPAPL